MFNMRLQLGRMPPPPSHHETHSRQRTRHRAARPRRGPATRCLPLRAGARRARAQPEGRRRRHPARRAGGVQRRLGLGQVLAGLRHALCRSAAPLPRVGGAVCAPADRPGGRARRRRHRGPAAGGGAAAAARHAQHALLGRQRDHAVEPAAHALFARRQLSARQPMLYAEDFSPNTPQGACPTLPRPGPRLRGHRSVDGAGRFAHHPRARHRRLAAGLARAEPARHPRVTLGYDVDTPWRELPQQGPRLDPLHRRAADRAGLRRLHAGGDARGAAPQDGAELHGHLHRRAQLRAAHLRHHAERADEEARGALHDRQRSARCARASGSSARRCRSPSPASTSASCRGCRSTSWRELLAPAAEGRFDVAPRRRALARAAQRAGHGAPRGGGRLARMPPRPTCGARRTCRKKSGSRRSASRTTCSNASRRCRSWAWATCRWTRSTPTLSPGELQRLRLATQIRSQPVRRGLRARRALGRPASRPTARRCCAALDRLKARGQLAVRRRARPRRDAPRRLAGRRRPGCRRARRPRAVQRPAARAARRSRQSQHRALPVRARRRPRGRQRARRAAGCGCDGITRNNLHGLDARVPAGRASPPSPACPARASRAWSARRWSNWWRAPGPRAARGRGRGRRRSTPDAAAADGRPHRRRRRTRSAAWCTSTRSRSAARRAPTSPPTPACSTTCASCSRPRRRREARRYDAGPLLLQRGQGPLRDLRGRGLRQRRAAVHAERLCAVPDLPRRALQRADAGDHLERQEHRRRAGA